MDEKEQRHIERFKEYVENVQSSHYASLARHHLNRPLQRYRITRINRADDEEHAKWDVLLNFEVHKNEVIDHIQELEEELFVEGAVHYFPEYRMKMVVETEPVQMNENKVVVEEKLVGRIYSMETNEDWKGAIEQERKAGRYTK